MNTHLAAPFFRNRRSLLGGGLGLLAAAAGVHAQALPPVEVWKDPNCGCCKEWVSHLESSGFKVKVHDTGNNAMRARLGIDKKYGSCHTATVGGYAIEGHVPARDIQRLLKDKPRALGLAVAGMPVGSPGMDGAVYGGRKDAYDVMLLAKDGSAKVYRHDEGVKTVGAGSAAPADLVDAEVRKVDHANRKITLKHGEIKSLEMPPMTMVFQVRNARLLDKVKAGDKVRFAAINDGGTYLVTDLRPAE